MEYLIRWIREDKKNRRESTLDFNWLMITKATYIIFTEKDDDNEMSRLRTSNCFDKIYSNTFQCTVFIIKTNVL